MPHDRKIPASPKTAIRRRVQDLAERLYAYSPTWAQNVMCTVAGARVQSQRYPPRFEDELDDALTRMSWSREKLERARVERLRAMLLHAEAEVPYWRDLFARRGLVPRDVTSPEDLRVLPPLTKDIVAREGARMRAEHVPASRDAGRPLAMKTSGSTGAGLGFVLSESGALRQWAMYWRFLDWHGVPRDAWSAQLTGRVIVPLDQRDGPLYRINHAGRQLLLSGYHLSPATAPDYLEAIRARDIPRIHGYPSLIVILADAAHAHGTKLPALKWVTLASETVTPNQRARIREGFGLEPRELYTQTEAVAHASEDPDGVIRIDDDFSVVELVADPSIDGARRVYGTSLDNWHQPFIRYDTGDLAREATDQPWRAPGRALSEIDGRREDYVELPSGALVGRTDHIFKELSFIREAQIRQRVPGRIRILVVPRDAWSEDRARALRREARARLGDDTRVEIELTDMVPRGPNGKLRLVVREDDG